AHQGERDRRNRRERARQQEIALAPAAEEGHGVREQSVHGLDHPRDEDDPAEVRDLGGRQPELVLERERDHLIGVVYFSQGMYHVTDQMVTLTLKDQFGL